MASSIRSTDLKEVLQDYHRRQYRGNTSSNENEDANDTGSICSAPPTTGESELCWDETVADDDCNSFSNADETCSFQQQTCSKRGGTLTPHALAHKSWVYGIAEAEDCGVRSDVYDSITDHEPNSFQNSSSDCQKQDHGDQSELGWKIRWKTSLAPHRVHKIASNPSGTIIAATTDNGTVSIIRGCDGRVLATRRVTAAKNDDDDKANDSSSSFLGMTPEVSFVTTKVSETSKSKNPRDALLVQTPDQPALLVSNIQGDLLNDNDDNVVTQATKSMNLQVVQIPSIEANDVQYMCGYFHSPSKTSGDGQMEEDKEYLDTIRLVLIHLDLCGEARMALAEYDLGSQLCHILGKNISLDERSEWEIDTMVGLRFTSIQDRFILALVAHPTITPMNGQQKSLQQRHNASSKIMWLDPEYDLGSRRESEDTKNSNANNVATIKGEYPLVASLKQNDASEEHYKRYQRPRIQAFEFLHSFDSQEAMAMVISMDENKEEKVTETQIIQVQTMVDECSKVLSLGRAHMLYQIHAPSNMQQAGSISICALDSKMYGPYSFRSKSSLGWNHHGQMHTFQTRKSGEDLRCCSAIGAIRLLITKNEYDKARALVHEVGMEALLDDQFANFHPAEIILQRLRRSLSDLLECNDTMSSLATSRSEADWNESLIGLGRGAGNLKGQRVFLEATDYILKWPMMTDTSGIDFEIIMKRLDSFLKTLRSASDDFLDQDVPSWITATYKNRMYLLEEKFTAIEYMNSSLEILKADIELDPRYASVSSIGGLFSCLVGNGNFSAAEKIWGSTMKSKLTSSILTSSTLQISPTIHPREYSNLVEYIVLPSLSINHELLSSILSWSCKLADDFETADEKGLDKSIFLLETIVRATKRLRLKVHSSFAYFSPFIESSKDRLNVSVGEIHSLDSSIGSEGRTRNSRSGDDLICLDDRRKKKPRINSDDQQPNPTVLELGHMKRGAARSGQIQSLSVDTIDENDEIVEMKLEMARWLKLARSLGLRRELISLHNFVDQGGARFAAKELIRLYSSSAKSHDERYNSLINMVKTFCDVSRCGYDEALIEYSNELCRGKNTNPRSIEEVASIARCCIFPTSKCKITKIALQAALLCRFSPTWLTNLSKDAIEWSAGDSSLRSELEEASRLLLIDGIVGRYCGNGAKELFHIDNPLHATRLLDFVSNHLNNSTVLSDILDLCEAFHHLSVEDGCGRLLQNVILRGNQEMAIKILGSLYERNVNSAHNVFSRVISFCIDLIGDNSSQIGPFPCVNKGIEPSMRLKESVSIANCAHELTKIAIVHARMIIHGRFGSGFTFWQYDEARLEILLLDLERLITLQQDHNIFVSLADLNDPKIMVGIASKLLNSLAEMYLEGKRNAASMIATQTKKACSLLSRPPMLNESDLLFAAATPIACHIALQTNGFEAFDFLADLRILEASQSNLAARCCIAVSLSYCRKLSRSKSCLSDTMGGLVMASSLLQDYVLSHCPPEIIGVAIDFSQLCDVVSQVLARTDEGFGEKLDLFRKTLLERAAEKRWSFAHSDSGSRISQEASIRLSKPTLHPSWYVGDGLLLPPEEALQMGVTYCKQTMGLQIVDNQSMGIHTFLANRGAHALALRILSHTTTTQLCFHRNESQLDDLEDFNQQISIALVERYLGGTGNGITSGVVDSQLAVSFLLSIPLKLAFKIYRSSLPTAINTRDFRRVVTLATIGKVSGSEESIIPLNGARLGSWTRQNKFVLQCDRLATRANWWYVLEENHVNFNPHSFDDEIPSDGLEDSYIASIISALISNMMSNKDGQIDRTLALSEKFARTFSIPMDLPASYLIQYLLSPMKSENDNPARKQVSCLNNTVKKLLRSLSCSSKRMNILRRCLIKFEKEENCVDYERLSIIYALYQTELSLVLSRDLAEENNSLDSLYMEMDIIDRRRDALAILSSYFQGDKKDGRPSFSKFFAPLNESIHDNTNVNVKTKRFCSRVLGWEAPPEVDTFDPLDPLENILRSTCSSAVTSALSPICIPLCIPRGYVKVRSLITRFQKSCGEGASLPTFDDDVLPVLNQLRAHSDIAEVAEWCSKQYALNNPDKLTCLDHALNYAIKASTEAENGSKKGKEYFVNQEGGKESIALARVKRITAAKDLLEDRLEITKILQPQNTNRTAQNPVQTLLQKLQEKLEAEVWTECDTFVPERFVDALFTKASLLVAEATLCEGHSLSVGQFRQLSHLVHRVCMSIACKYSHVQSSYIARRLTRRWLLYGDEKSARNEENDNGIIPVLSQNDNLIPDIDEDDTMNFEMDLSMLKADPSDFGMVAFSSTVEKKRLTSEEEPSSLKATSRREMSEFASHRSALRIAFVLAFVDDYRKLSAENDDQENDENCRKSVNQKSKISRRGLLSKTKKKSLAPQVDQHTSVFQHARDITEIVFAKSTSLNCVMNGMNTSFDSISVAGIDRKNPATITFAMRHRCLRVASILVPQEALEEVLNENQLNANLSLKACSFGSFCAKELEEMGLPIPHSDLIQLSQMHFPSYARALWRHHRDTKASKGRLLLLILELYLKEPVSDNSFFLSILGEIESLKLPRTLLLGLECVSRYMDKIGPESALSFLEKNNLEISRITGKLLQLVYDELKRTIENLKSDESRDDGSEERRGMMNTLSRLSRIVVTFANTPDGQDLLIQFCKEQMKYFPELASTDDERQCLRIAIEFAIYRIETENVQVNMSKKLFDSMASRTSRSEKDMDHGDATKPPSRQLVL